MDIRKSLSLVFEININGDDDEKNIEFFELINDNIISENKKENDVRQLYNDKKGKGINKLIKRCQTYTKSLPDNTEEEKSIIEEIKIFINIIKRKKIINK